MAYADGVHIRELVPLLGTFLFELVGDDEEGKDMSLTAVQPGTSKPTIEAWNLEELVPIMWCKKGTSTQGSLFCIPFMFWTGM